jgi:hypothetical protein
MGEYYKSEPSWSMKLVRGQTAEAAGAMVTARVAATVAAEVADPEAKESEGIESLVVICALKTDLYIGDSWWRTIYSHVFQEGGHLISLIIRPVKLELLWKR